MARKKPEKSEAGVRYVKFEDARCLVTIQSDSVEWIEGYDARTDPLPTLAIVRLQPPVTATDKDVANLRASYEEAGAARVTVLPRPRPELITAASKEARPDKAIGARTAVVQLIAESNSKDKAALGVLCETIMAKNGL